MIHKNDPHFVFRLTCSMTSGAIQQGVPTKVCLTVSLVMSLPVANHALTPKSTHGKSVISINIAITFQKFNYFQIFFLIMGKIKRSMWDKN